MRIDDVVRHYQRTIGMPLVEQGAVIVRDEIRSTIDISDTPSEPGAPPHSTGPYKDSWKASRGRITRNSVSAVAFSTARVGENDEYSLAAILEFDLGRPHIRTSIPRARQKIAALARRLFR